jgi:zinc protease
LKLKALLPLSLLLTVLPLHAADPSNVTRATLPNGLQVVIVHSALAPVVTVELNFKVGGDETPPGFPGSAHAEEHMAFRGCTGMTADQTAAIYAQLGGRDNADTQQNITQYFTTVPAADLDVALQAQAACLRGVDDSEEEWAHERGAIEQEVSRDLSNPTYKFIDRLNGDMFAGTPYAHDPLGTRPSFDATTGAMLKAFYKQWYTPGNAILVIVGDVDPAVTIAKVKQLYGDIPNHPVPEHPAINLTPVKPETFTLDSNLPYVLGFIAYRMPGTDSPDYAAAQVLSDILASQRADIYGMVPAGKALYASFGIAENYPKASIGFGEIALPAGADSAGPINELRQIIEGYAQKGLPQDLFDAAKRSEIASDEFQRNSIPGLASAWSEALTAEGRNSPEDDLQAIRKVTLADVNRVAKQYLVPNNSITATLKPSPSGEAVAAKGFGGEEKMTSAPTKPVVLPDWAKASLSQLKVPADYIVASDTTFPNGLRLIVKTDHTSPTVTVVGTVKNNADLQTPKGKEGVSDVLDGLYSYGSTTLDRLAFQKALDDIAANETAGFDFSVQTLKENFSRGVQLLADNELHPALPAEAFSVVKDQTVQFVAGNLKSPGYRTSRALDIALLPSGDPTLR